MKQPDFIALDQKIEYLVSLCQQLQADNRRLQHQQKTWRVEKAQLMEKNDLARHKIEAMLGRVRALEQES
ncbi:TIGR02449 family protein [Endozoicomonas sp. (ex Bugula neritina AB1)]|nr:TIGR02449 family protein [Endozoicomonas sp. (ex Bugula neritina AB1)]